MKLEALIRLRFIFKDYNLINILEDRLTRKPADAVIIDCFDSDLKDGQRFR